MTDPATPPLQHPRKTVLVIDDGPGDVELLREAFRTAAPDIDLRSVSDGVAALRYLGREGEFADAPIPHLAIVDLGLPRLDGRAVLQFLRRQTKRIPAVVLSGSSRRLDRDESLRLGAVHYAVKPIYFGDYLLLVEFIVGYLRRPANDHPNSTPTPLGTHSLV